MKRQVSIALTPETRVGDYVLLHTGYAIGVVDEAEVRLITGDTGVVNRGQSDKLIILDAVKGDKEPGTIYRFTCDTLMAKVQIPKFKH